MKRIVPNPGAMNLLPSIGNECMNIGKGNPKRFPSPIFKFYSIYFLMKAFELVFLPSFYYTSFERIDEHEASSLGIYTEVSSEMYF